MRLVFLEENVMTRERRVVWAITLGGALSIAGISPHTVMDSFFVPYRSFVRVQAAARAQAPARAQTGQDPVSHDLVDLFAKVVLEIEPYRVEALEASNNSVNDREKDDIQRNFIRQATEILESHGMAVADYNRITIQLRQDDELREQIEAAIRGLQQNDA